MGGQGLLLLMGLKVLIIKQSNVILPGTQGLLMLMGWIDRDDQGTEHWDKKNNVLWPCYL